MMSCMSDLSWTSFMKFRPLNSVLSVLDDFKILNIKIILSWTILSRLGIFKVSTSILRVNLMASSGLNGLQYFDFNLERRGRLNGWVGLKVFRISTSILDVEVDEPGSTFFDLERQGRLNDIE